MAIDTLLQGIQSSRGLERHATVIRSVDERGVTNSALSDNSNNQIAICISRQTLYVTRLVIMVQKELMTITYYRTVSPNIATPSIKPN